MIRKIIKLILLAIYYNYLLNAWYWLQIECKRARKMGRKFFRKIFTWACKFIYKHPTLYKIADNILCRNSPEWRKITGKFAENQNKVLEVGCGRFPAPSKGALLDSSIPLLKVAPSEGFLKVCSSANELPFRNKAFDCILSVFPPGIGADEGFAQEEKFWREACRVLSDNGKFIVLVYINYKNWFLRFISSILDPLKQDFWDNLWKITGRFKISRYDQLDSKGNGMIFVIAEKK